MLHRFCLTANTGDSVAVWTTLTEPELLTSDFCWLVAYVLVKLTEGQFQQKLRWDDWNNFTYKGKLGHIFFIEGGKMTLKIFSFEGEYLWLFKLNSKLSCVVLHDCT